MYNNGESESVVHNPIISLYNNDSYSVITDSNAILLLDTINFLLFNGQNFDLL